MNRAMCHAVEGEHWRLPCRIAGIEGRHVAFLLPDSHIVNEAFVEDISNLLDSGEVAGLFAADERERIFSEIRFGNLLRWLCSV
jgi:hypothetical protein